MRDTRAGMLAGVAAAAVALGVGELVAIAVGARYAPLVAVGAAVIDLVPQSVELFAIGLFGTYDKIALQVGIVVLLGLLAVVIGRLSVRRAAYGMVGVALLGAVGIAAAVTRPHATIMGALPALVGAVAAAVIISRHWTKQGAEPTAELMIDPRGRVFERRVLLGALAGAGVAGVGGRLLAEYRDVGAARTAVKLPSPVSTAAPLPADADLRASTPGIAPYVTPKNDFYRIDTALVFPRIDPMTWQLKIHGRVARPLTLSWEQLLARPMVERHITLSCVSNEVGGNLVGNARWLGVPLKDLLDEVNPAAGADQLVSRSADGWTCGTPTAACRDGRDALLAVAMNGEPLPVEHGFPVRMVVPGLYGYVSATKWLVELELSTFADFDAYWIKKGWAQQGPVKTASRIDAPRDGATAKAGRVMVGGVAWAVHRGVEKVEVRVDGGDWQPAKLGGVPSADTWRHWTWPWDATPGEHKLEVRATDGGGAVQPAERRPVTPDGATGWHSVNVTVDG